MSQKISLDTIELDPNVINVFHFRELHPAGESISLHLYSSHNTDEVSLFIEVDGQSFLEDSISLENQRVGSFADIRYRDDEGFTLSVGGELIAQVITGSAMTPAESPHLIVVRAQLHTEHILPYRIITVVEGSLGATLSRRELPHLERLVMIGSITPAKTLYELSSSGLKTLELYKHGETRALSFTGDALEELELCAIPDLESLSVKGCPALTKLSCWHLPSADITLRELPALTSLNITLNDCSALVGLTHLKKLKLQQADFTMSNLSALATLKGLEELELSIPSASSAELACLSELRTLRTLRLYTPTRRYSSIELSWLDALTELRSLNINCDTACFLCEFSGLSHLKSLKLECKLVGDLNALSGCGQIQEITLGSLTNIRSLEPLGDLTAITRLRLEGLKHDHDLSPLSRIPKLKSLTLRASELYNFKELSSLSALSYLTSEAAHINNLKGLSSLSALSDLTIEATRVDELSALASIPSLRSLSIRGLDHAQTDLANLRLPEHFESLSLSNISSLCTLEPLSTHQQLKRLHIDRCCDLRSLRGVERLSSLKSLSVDHNTGALDLSSLRALNQLEELEISPWGLIKDFTLLKDAHSLKSLEIGFKSNRYIADLEELEELDARSSESYDLTGLTSLEELTLSPCSVSGLETLSGLKKLRIDCGVYPRKSGLIPENLSLTKAGLNGAVTVTSDHLEWLPALPNIQTLEIVHAYQLTDLSPLTSMRGLRSLSLSFAVKLTDLSPLASLTELTRLELLNLKRIEDLNPLCALTSLRSLSLRGCERLSSLGSFESFDGHLDTSWCFGLELQGMTPEMRLETIRVNRLNTDGDLDSAQVGDLPAPSAQVSIMMSATNNRQGLHPLQICSCYHCCTRYLAKHIKSSCDGGDTIICPVCGIDSVHIGVEPISELIQYGASMF